MAITFIEDLRYQPYSGAIDPALPIGHWQCSVNGLGDASGGQITLSHTLVASGQGDPSLWSLEQLGYQLDSASDFNGICIIQNQENRVDPATPITVTFQLEPRRASILGRIGIPGNALTFLPYFIGRGPGREAAARLAVQLVIDNVNGIAFRSLIWGYRWGGRAYDTPTGPRVPVGGVFRG